MLVLVTLLFVTVCNSQNWVYRTAFPGDNGNVRRGKTAVAVGTKLYVGLGLAGNTFYKDWWEYNTLTNTWTRLTDLPGGTRYDAASFVIGSTIYVGGGDTYVKSAEGNVGTYVKDFYAFNTQTNTWSNIPDSPDPVGEAASFSIDGRGYVTCGRNNNQISYSFRTWCYDPSTNSWSARTNFPGSHARAYPIAFAINGRGYVGGGYQGSWVILPAPGAFPDYYRDFYEYTPATDTWTRKGDLPNISTDVTVSMIGGAVAAHCDRGYVVGGPQSRDIFSSGGKRVYEYRANSDTWIQMPDFPIAILNGQACIINGTLYAGGATAISGQSNKIWSYSLQDITVPAEICTTLPISFQNPTSNATVSWQSSNTSGLTIGATGVNVNGTRVNNFNNEVTVTATMTAPNGCLVTRTKPIWLGVPWITNQTLDGGTYYPGIQTCPGNHYLNVTPKGGTVSAAIWTVQGGVPFTAGTNILNFTFPSSLSSVTISARATNICGTSGNTSFFLSKRTWGCSSFFSLAVFPNPVEDELTIHATEIDSVSTVSQPVPIAEAFLVDRQGNIVAVSAKDGNNAKINVNRLKKGQYFLHVRVGKETATEQIIIE